MKKIYAEALYMDPGATLDDLREAVRALEDLERTGRRVLGSSHPRVRATEVSLEHSRAALRARETPSPSSSAPDSRAADDDATPAAPAAADSRPGGSSGEAPSARDAEDPSSK